MPRSLRSLVIAALAGAALGASGLVALADPPRGGFSPDPPPLASRKHWTFELTSRGGKISIDRAKPIFFEKPVETQRAIGRFALELYIGRELLDRVRFNVPLMGAEPTQGNRNRLPKPRFDQNVASHFSVRLADNPRAAYLLMVDRETGDTQKLAWPPDPDGRLQLWTSGLSDAAAGDFPDGGVRAVGHREAGAADAADGSKPSVDAGRD